MTDMLCVCFSRVRLAVGQFADLIAHKTVFVVGEPKTSQNNFSPIIFFNGLMAKTVFLSRCLNPHPVGEGPKSPPDPRSEEILQIILKVDVYTVGYNVSDNPY